MPTSNPRSTKLGLIVGNRGFFPDHLAASGREEMIRVLKDANVEVIAPTPKGSNTDPTLIANESKFGAVETFEEAKGCAELFKRHRDTIDGVIVSLPNFGDERAIADTLRLSGLNVPVLVQATPDNPNKMTITDRRDSFCGKMSACNNLMQYGIPYSLTTLHTEAPTSEEFKKDLAWFIAVCHVVRGMRNLRVGAIGARPAAFNTVRYSEKLLEANGISVITLDLSEVLGRISRMSDQDDAAKSKLEDIKRYVSTLDVPAESLTKMAKLGAVIDGWMREQEVSISAVQCWTSLEENFGVVPCTGVPRVSRLMALALKFQCLLSQGTVRSHADLAELGHVSRTHVCQILMLTNLAPAIQEALLFLPKSVRGPDRITENRLRGIASLVDWDAQIQRFRSHLAGSQQ